MHLGRVDLLGSVDLLGCLNILKTRKKIYFNVLEDGEFVTMFSLLYLRDGFLIGYVFSSSLPLKTQCHK